jgi:O-antigen/teichoic acid export membrane protein
MRQRAYAFVSVTLAFVTTSVTAVLVLGFRVGVLGALVGQLCGACAAAIAVVALSRGAYRPVFDPERCRRMLSFSMPLVPASAGVFLNNFADRYAVLQTRSLNAVGVYGVGFRISAAVTLLLLGFQGAATPLITARHGEESTREELARIFRIFVTMALALFVALSLFADALVHVLASSAYAGADTVVPYLTMGALLFGGYVFAPGLWLSRRTKLSAGIAVIAGLLNLGLALALTPSLGIRGAGIATAVSSGVFLVPTLVLSQRFYAVPHQWLRLVAALALAIAVVVAGRALLPVGGVHAVALAPLAEKAAVTLAAMAALAALVLQRAEIAGIAGVLRRRAGSGAGGAAQGAVDEVEHDR